MNAILLITGIILSKPFCISFRNAENLTCGDTILVFSDDSLRQSLNDTIENFRVKVEGANNRIAITFPEKNRKSDITRNSVEITGDKNSVTISQTKYSGISIIQSGTGNKVLIRQNDRSPPSMQKSEKNKVLKHQITNSVNL